MSKGSKQRPTDITKFNANYDDVDWTSIKLNSEENPPQQADEMIDTPKLSDDQLDELMDVVKKWPGRENKD